MLFAAKHIWTVLRMSRLLFLGTELFAGRDEFPTNENEEKMR